MIVVTQTARRGGATLPRHRVLRLRAIVAVGLAIAASLMLSLLSMAVSAARERVVAADRQVSAVRRDYAMLVTEYEVRSRPRQLLSWGETSLSLAPPDAHQYLVRLDDLDALARRPPGATSPRA